MSSKQNIWGTTTVVSIEAAVLAACTLMAATQLEIANAVNGEEFSAAEVLSLGQASIVEYTEKQFEGPAMSDDEWASL